MLVNEMSDHAFLYLLQHGSKLQGVVLHRRLDISDKNLAVIMAARYLIQLFPIYSNSLAFFDVG
ncbi:hypothetical protein D3C71_1907160 [compost metagenome]